MVIEDAFASLTDPGLARTEGMLLAAGDEVSRAMRRARRRVGAELYAELVEWAAHLRISLARSHHTAGRYLDSVTEFVGWLANTGRQLEALTANDIERWQQWLAVAGRAMATTRGNKLVAVRRWLGWREQYHGHRNPAREIQGPKREQRLARKYSKLQLRAMLAAPDRSKAIGKRDYAALLFFLATGARRGEVAGLRLSQLELQERVGAVRFFGKGAKERVVTFEGVVVPAMREWLAARDSLSLVNREAVFITQRGPKHGHGLTRTGLDGLLRRAVKAAKLRLEPGMALHALRATFATAMYDAGTDLEQIRILMGHDDINTTRKYIAISDRQLKTRLPREFLADVTGEGRQESLPLHARHELRRRGYGDI